jgi:hypothetical protein
MKWFLNMLVFLIPLIGFSQLELKFSEILLSSKDQDKFSSYFSSKESVLLEVEKDSEPSVYQFQCLEEGNKVWHWSHSKPSSDKKYLVQYTSVNHPFYNKYYTKRQILDSVVIANEEYWNMLLEDTSIHSIGIKEEGIFYCPDLVLGSCYGITTKFVSYAWQYNEEEEAAALFAHHSYNEHYSCDIAGKKNKNELILNLNTFDNDLYFKFLKELKTISMFKEATNEENFGLCEVYSYYDPITKKSCRILVQKKKDEQGGEFRIIW